MLTAQLKRKEVVLDENGNPVKYANRDVKKKTITYARNLSGTITEGGEKDCTVRFDNGRELYLPEDDAKKLTLGYAVTTHKSQGATVTETFKFGGRSLVASREALYVGQTRATDKTHLYVASDEEIDETIDEMATLYSRVNMTLNALDYLDAQTQKDLAAFSATKEAETILRMDAKKQLEEMDQKVDTQDLNTERENKKKRNEERTRERD